MAETPNSIKPHAADYFDRAWESYSFSQLGDWVSLLAARAQHRVDPTKRQKDLYDAQNYLNMLQAKLNALYPNVSRERA